MPYSAKAATRSQMLRIAGVNYTPAGSFPVSGITVNYTQHFSGNVWWTSAAHWHSLPEQVKLFDDLSLTWALALVPEPVSGGAPCSRPRPWPTSSTAAVNPDLGKQHKP
jgi:hypothetical protein